MSIYNDVLCWSKISFVFFKDILVRDIYTEMFAWIFIRVYSFPGDAVSVVKVIGVHTVKLMSSYILSSLGIKY